MFAYFGLEMFELPEATLRVRSSGFAVIDHLEREVYLCRRGQRHYAAEPPPPIR